MTAPVFVPIPHLVAIAWLKSLDFLAPYVGLRDIAQKYQPPATWQETYAITCNVVTPRAHQYAPLKLPIVQIDVFGRPVQTTAGPKTPWNTCAAIAELIAEETYNPINLGEVEVGGPTVMRAKVGNISLVRAPNVVGRADASQLARASLDVQISYTPVYGELS